MYLLLFTSANFPFLANVAQVSLVEVVLFTVDSHSLNGVKGFGTKSAFMNKDTAMILADMVFVAGPRVKLHLKHQRYVHVFSFQNIEFILSYIHPNSF